MINYNFYTIMVTDFSTSLHHSVSCPLYYGVILDIIAGIIVLN